MDMSRSVRKYDHLNTLLLEEMAILSGDHALFLSAFPLVQ